MEVEISGVAYRIGKLDARRQFHVVRRLLPALTGIASVAELAKGNFLQQAKPLADALAEMPNEKLDYVIDTALSVVQRRIEGGRGWASVTTSGGALMFEDIGLAVMLRLTVEVVKENLDGFFDALRQMSPEGSPPQE